MIILNIIMGVSYYPVLFILYYFEKKMGKFEKGLFHGAAMTVEWYKDPENKPVWDEISQQFKKGINKYLLVFGIVPIAFFFIPYFSISFTVWIIWLFAAIVGCIFPQIKAFNAVKKYKIEKGYGVNEEHSERFVDLQSFQVKKLLPKKALILPVIVCALTGICPLVNKLSGTNIDPGVHISYFVMLGSVLLVIFVYYFMANAIVSKWNTVVCEDSDINMNYSRAKRNIWSKLYYQTAWISVIFLLPMAACYFYDKYIMIVLIVDVIIYSLVVLILTVKAFANSKKIDKVYSEYFNPIFMENDEKNWIWGMFYYNPKDKRNFVEARMGLGLTSNMAKGWAKALDVFAVVMLVGCLGLCVWMMQIEFTPLKLQVVNNHIEAIQLSKDYDFDIAEITEAELITELPKMSKSNGNAMDNQRTGTYYIRDEQKKCQVFLNPQHKLFIRFAIGDKVYFIGGEDETQTAEIYQTIQQNMKK